MFFVYLNFNIIKHNCTYVKVPTELSVLIEWLGCTDMVRVHNSKQMSSSVHSKVQHIRCLFFPFNLNFPMLIRDAILKILEVSNLVLWKTGLGAIKHMQNAERFFVFLS